MKEYIAKKLCLLIPTVLAITLLVFAMMRFIPGDPIHLLLGDMYDQRQADELRHAYGLDQPLLVQYVRWLARLIQGDWGQSVLTWLCTCTLRVNTTGSPVDRQRIKKSCKRGHHVVTAALCTVVRASKQAVQAHVAT